MQTSVTNATQNEKGSTITNQMETVYGLTNKIERQLNQIILENVNSNG